MTISFSCSCGKKYKVPDEKAGAAAKCPGCGRVLKVPSPVAKPGTAKPGTAKPGPVAKPSAARSAPVAIPERPYDAFISHSVKDSGVAEAICTALERGGTRCWMAPRDIVAGKNWAEAIMQGIGTCRVMVLVFSSHSNCSKQVNNEVNHAFQNGLSIVPFRIEDVPMSEKLKYYLATSQWFDAMTPPLESHVESLCDTVRVLLKQAPAPTPPPLPGSGQTPAAAGPDQPSTSGAAGKLAMIAAAVFLVGLLAFGGWWWTSSGPEGSPGDQVALSVEDKADQSDEEGTSEGVSGDEGESEKEGDSEEEGSKDPKIVPVPDPNPPSPPDPPSPPSLVWGNLLLEGGDLLFRSEGASIEWIGESGSANPLDADSNDPDAANRLIRISNRRGPAADEPKPDSEVELAFLLNNQSDETVILSQLELCLLGIVTVYEDQITKPQSPRVKEWIDDLDVEERAAPIKGYVDLAESFVDSDTPLVDLRFQVSNSNSDLVTASLNGTQLDLGFALVGSGSANITVRATDPFELSSEQTFTVTVKSIADVEPVFGGPPPGAAAEDSFSSGMPNEVTGRIVPIAIEEKKQRLGTVVLDHHLDRLDVITPISTGNLLPRDSNTVLQSNSATSFTLNVRPCLSLDLPTGGPPEDVIANPHDLRRKLSVQRPRPKRTIHLLLLRVRANSQGGDSCEVCCDQLVELVSYPADEPEEAESSAPSGNLVMSLDSADTKDLREWIEGALKIGVPIYEETQAYNRATLCAAVPEGFDPGAVSPACYFGDRRSPFRGPSVTTGISDGDLWPRSNLPGTFAAVRNDDSDLWQSIQKELDDLLYAGASGQATTRNNPFAVEEDVSEEPGDGDEQKPEDPRIVFLREEMSSQDLDEAVRSTVRKTSP